MATTIPIDSKQGYADNKERGYNSKAKSLIYGGDEKPATPIREGKRSVSHKGSNAPAPFATFDEGGPAGKDFHSKPKTKEGAGKVGGDAFNADVYRQQIASNQTNMAASKAKAYSGNGVFN